MARLKISGGWYDEESHGYYDESGRFVPSATQIIKLTGLSNYDFVPPETLARKAKIGTEVHNLTVLHDQHGDLDPTWVPDERAPYLAAYEKFVHEKSYEPDPAWTERAVIAELYGMRYGVTPDRVGKLAGNPVILELKCVENSLPSWGVQTCLQHVAVHRGRTMGQSQRMALQLLKSGKYKLDHHKDDASDLSVATAALTIVYARMRFGEKVWERV